MTCLTTQRVITALQNKHHTPDDDAPSVENFENFEEIVCYLIQTSYLQEILLM